MSPASDEDEDVDKSLAHIGNEARALAQSKKGRVQQIGWDAELEEMSREKAAAEATRGEYWTCVKLRRALGRGA